MVKYKINKTPTEIGGFCFSIDMVNENGNLQGSDLTLAFNGELCLREIDEKTDGTSAESWTYIIVNDLVVNNVDALKPAMVLGDKIGGLPPVAAVFVFNNKKIYIPPVL
jgi:hypothetical protein